ncbi:kif19 [Symbiodinium necroappetens]|uniref:Kif19 protein n=1 Tax=Symbiodinium necroappetens TaxID=1628268 RepID=A0A812J3D5_9DINO|nr:kif19 [Symbiodinium necroappetens]
MEEELSNEVHNHYTAAKAREEKKVLQRELQAREHLLSAFGSTSHRLMTAKQLVSGAADKQRFQQLKQEVEKLGQSPSHTELQILMSSFDNLVQQEEQELTDAVVTAVSRQEQAESRDQHELEDLKAKMLKLDSSAQTPAIATKTERNKLERICAVTMSGVKARHLQREVQCVAIRFAIALVSELTLP